MGYRSFLAFAGLIILCMHTGCRSLKWKYKPNQKFFLKTNLFYNIKPLRRGYGMSIGVFPIADCPVIVNAKESTEFISVGSTCTIRPMPRHRGFIVSFGRENAEVYVIYQKRYFPHESLEDYVQRFISVDPVSLATLETRELEAIKSGRIFIGMSEEAITRSWGEPFKIIKLPDQQKWVYWKYGRRWFHLSMVKGRLNSIRDPNAKGVPIRVWTEIESSVEDTK